MADTGGYEYDAMEWSSAGQGWTECDVFRESEQMRLRTTSTVVPLLLGFPTSMGLDGCPKQESFRSLAGRHWDPTMEVDVADDVGPLNDRNQEAAPNLGSLQQPSLDVQCRTVTPERHHCLPSTTTPSVCPACLHDLTPCSFSRISKPPHPSLLIALHKDDIGYYC